MADGTGVSDCSCLCFTSIYQPKHNDFCINCKALKCELQKTQEELKSPQLIIALLVQEINFTKASTGASKNMYHCKYDDSDFSSNESNGPGTNNWIPVKNGHSDNIRHKNTQQLNNLITLSNSSVVLGNLYESSDKATTNIPKVHKALRVQRNIPKTPKKHSVLLVGDSHIRGVAERWAIKLRSSFHTIGYVKPKPNLKKITSSMKSEIKNFSKSNVVVLCGGTLDVAKNNTTKGVSSILQFVKNNEHTNMNIMDAPHRFDLEVSSCVNKEVNAFNRKLNKIIKSYDH